ncbi:hypothetical protein [Nodosilinea sp. P-1105]|uniref:tetratricopeptide repeat protein n=1 Tax=Nodosilinea sp. P-1105 TaxID=2546229 RepID=UPI00146E793D|nr:hypothetical protein [Nodosilinea sp. P-1105]NMF84356.1 hypothetical protein [Nodosilinea sp. P-1105]
MTPRNPLSLPKPGGTPKSGTILGHRATTLAFVGILAVSAGCAQLDQRPDSQDSQVHDHQMGVVDFPVSCDTAAQSEIETGLAHLHHMMYEQARPHFSTAADLDADCAMAHWGVAMTSFQPLWHPTSDTDMERGKAAVETALALGVDTDREEQYLAAVSAFFTDPEPAQDSRARDHEARVMAWKQAQRELHTAYPEDVDAAAFYALANVSYATTQFSPDQEADYTRQRQAGALLEDYLEDHPQHPGLFHYLIHAYDSTELAPKAEDIAREYDQLAPETVHALHMPSHIFVRMGLWEETIEWNERSAAAARREMEDDPHASAHYVHALDYIMYGHLQLGNEAEAQQTLERVHDLDEIYSASFAAYNTAALQARYYLEQQDWQAAAQLEPRTPDALVWEDFPAGEALFYYARGLGAARSGDLAQAEVEGEQLQALADTLQAAGDDYWAYMTEALSQAVEAWTLYERGDTDQALALMSAAADLEDSMDKHPTTPGEVLPVRELYGELLLQENRLAEAEAAFEASLERTPNRRNALQQLDQVAIN